jgi:hypothetical protein
VMSLGPVEHDGRARVKSNVREHEYRRAHAGFNVR